MQLPPNERLALIDYLLDTLDEPDASMEALWAKEAETRPVAYRRGGIRAVALSDVIVKYPASPKSA